MKVDFWRKLNEIVIIILNFYSIFATFAKKSSAHNKIR